MAALSASSSRLKEWHIALMASRPSASTRTPKLPRATSAIAWSRRSIGWRIAASTRTTATTASSPSTSTIARPTCNAPRERAVAPARPACEEASLSLARRASSLRTSSNAACFSAASAWKASMSPLPAIIPVTAVPLRST